MTLCPTGWTVCGDSLCSVITNYAILQDTYVHFNRAKMKLLTEIKSRIIGVSAHMTSFEYVFGILLGECVNSHKH